MDTLVPLEARLFVNLGVYILLITGLHHIMRDWAEFRLRDKPHWTLAPMWPFLLVLVGLMVLAARALRSSKEVLARSHD